MSEKTYYEKQWEDVEFAENTEEMLEIIKKIDFSKKIEKDSDAKFIKKINVRKDLIKEGVIKNKSEIDKLKKEGKREYSEEEKQEMRIKLQYAYEFINQGLRKYLDMEEENYNLVALWIIGTYSHEDFPSYPYLFLNAMRGSGKSRLMKLITFLSKEGEMLNSLTEAVLFRSKGTLCIDEFEGLGRKGSENLKELLNSAYKKGTKVKRLRKVKAFDGEKQEIETFDVYRPIIMANIYGLIDEALKDRCITLILEKSDNRSKTNLIELFEYDENLQNAKNILNQCSLCSVVSLLEVYKKWNLYVTNYNYTYTLTTQTTQTSQKNEFFDKIMETSLNGREIELCLPLLIISKELNVFEETLNTLKNIFLSRKEDELNENLDITLYDFFATTPENESFVAIKEILQRFKDFSGRNDEFINERWIGRRLTTLKLVKMKKRLGSGIYVIIDYKKAQDKIRLFREE